MAKGAYIGIDGIARKIKKGYVGIATAFPVTEESTVNVTASNISSVFTVTNGTYYFVGSGSTFTTNNAAVNSGVATTTLVAKKDMDVSFTYSYSSEASYDKFTLTIAGSVIENAVSGTTTTKTWSGSIKTGDSIEFKYAKDGSVNKNDDKCTFSNMVCTTAVDTGETITKNLARLIKKAYIGIGGVARPCWSGGELEYYGAITGLSSARYDLAATSVGGYALFGGGYDSDYCSTVNAYDTSLTRTTPTVLSSKRMNLAATSVGGYALFGGGKNGNSASDRVTVVDAYDTSLTRTAPTPLSSGRMNLAATSVGNYALFGGGVDSSGNSSIVNAYDTSLTRTTPTALSAARYDLAATSVGGYALFGGGYSSGTSLVVDAYDTSLTRTTPTVLSRGRYDLAATSVGEYALFGGGDASVSSVVDAYDTSLTRTTPTPLSIARYDLAATSVGGYALFGGGYGGGVSSVVDAYDTSLTRTTPTELSSARRILVATSVGDYALFGGGYGSTLSDSSSVVDAYSVA